MSRTIPADIPRMGQYVGVPKSAVEAHLSTGTIIVRGSLVGIYVITATKRCIITATHQYATLDAFLGDAPGSPCIVRLVRLSEALHARFMSEMSRILSVRENIPPVALRYARNTLCCHVDGHTNPDDALFMTCVSSPFMIVFIFNNIGIVEPIKALSLYDIEDLLYGGALSGANANFSPPIYVKI